MKKIAFYTLGCKVNQSDTASMEKLFRQAGYGIVDFADEADIYLINTCVVTNTGQRKSRQIINRAAKRNPHALIVVSGCYPQTAAEEVKLIAGVGLIIGNQDRAGVVGLVEQAMAKGSAEILDNVRALSPNTCFEEMHAASGSDKTRAFLKIQEGCNQFCTYCIIPYARGPLRSRSLDSIRGEVEALTAAGFREVVLLGIHLGAYGQEDKDGPALAEAVKAALSIPTLQRLRLGSLESIEVSDELLDLMAGDERLQKQLHLPLQSGSDAVLEKMRRPYTTKVYKELLAKIRKKLPDIAITTDIIVGFPGETEADFLLTMQFAQECGFSKIHIFPFSPRKGTPAAGFSGSVPEIVKQKRAGELAEEDRKGHEAYCRSFIGRSMSVLFEQKEGGLWSGFSGNYLRVYAASDEQLAGCIRDVVADELFLDGLKGTLL
ncbi:MAG: tRNA (N(6)-L-threonylcarbamoyladenosine(37)-C(2))-methylthiotransferase MtaB [Acholeplasmataceae bacterium]|nr:tRNA (N(6)-L-threonylcarbamoyladenosine(37)-C(2))-methylthiotransferase MtaB [Acidaminococcaceae bacterium]NLY84088.1 tRNA (N(6)-L-threonylcarbamoyladenosine(37)-C(2))-methylthiotransferase MtaB [Acholeplasmataceae bacterium]